MSTRAQTCPVDGQPLDDHTNDQMVECDEAATQQFDIARDFTPVAPQGKVHHSWKYELPERYQG